MGCVATYLGAFRKHKGLFILRIPGIFYFSNLLSEIIFYGFKRKGNICLIINLVTIKVARDQCWSAVFRLSVMVDSSTSLYSTLLYSTTSLLKHFLSSRNIDS